MCEWNRVALSFVNFKSFLKFLSGCRSYCLCFFFMGWWKSCLSWPFSPVATINHVQKGEAPPYWFAVCVCVCACVCSEDADLSCYGYRKPDWRQSALSRVQPLDCFCDIFFITSWENNLCKLQWCTEADHFTDYFGNEVHSVRQGISVIFSFINYWYYSPQLEEWTTRSSFFLSWLHLGLYVSASPT